MNGKNFNGYKRTKIIATLGPATDRPDILLKLLQEGADCVRLNFSHGELSEHQARYNQVRELSKKMGREIAVIADLQGPKIRIARFKEDKIILQNGQSFVLDARLADDVGNQTHVGIDYKQLPYDVTVDDILLLDDGRVILKAVEVTSTTITTEVLVGGELSNNKGINRQGGGLSAEFLTDKDRDDLKAAVGMGADYIAVSFPRNADDIRQARALVIDAGGKYVGIIAKIERSEAIADLENMIEASDAVMVARGDLGVEIGEAELPSVQKTIIHKCRSLDRAVITATQMMESMIRNTIPTRAEVFDVANAVLDGTDAVMLSAETAMGEHPQKVVAAMAKICRGTERNPISQTSKHRLESRFTRIDEAIAMAVMYTANHMQIRGIITLTESGSTPLWMSRIRSGIPIYGLSRHIPTLRKMALYRGVYPLYFDVTQVEHAQINTKVVGHLKGLDIIETGDIVILTKGDHMGVHGGSNSMKIISVL